MKDIEFCHIHCGELTEAECLQAIATFDVIRSEVRNVSPQVKALNQMLSQVRATYFVELDSDMVLNPNALERIEVAIDKYAHDSRWHTILFKLHDTFTEKDILSLKVMRTSIMKQFPFVDKPTPDVEHYSRLKEAGYYCVEAYLNTSTIGNHVLRGHTFCYHKYRDVYATRRFHNFNWDEAVFMGGHTIKQQSKKHFDYFLLKYITSDNEDYLSAIAGMVDGLTCEQTTSKSLNKKCIISNADAVNAYFDYFNSGYRTF